MDAEKNSQPLNFDTFVPTHDASLPSNEANGLLPPPESISDITQDEAFSKALNSMYWTGYWTAIYHVSLLTSVLALTNSVSSVAKIREKPLMVTMRKVERTKRRWRTRSRMLKAISCQVSDSCTSVRTVLHNRFIMFMHLLASENGLPPTTGPGITLILRSYIFSIVIRG